VWLFVCLVVVVVYIMHGCLICTEKGASAGQRVLLDRRHRYSTPEKLIEPANVSDSEKDSLDMEHETADQIQGSQHRQARRHRQTDRQTDRAGRQTSIQTDK
jgi:hypothetical protein